ncbi:hypothetical protein [Sorangium sp. So ce1078]|uniref:hypothetical protein n=1 Tax=Sorangium sp. So ce1078 TaxID=3133329 RepID=UPI003F5E9351
MNRSAMVFGLVLLVTGCRRGDLAPASSSSRTAAVSGGESGAQPPAAAAPASGQPAPPAAAAPASGQPAPPAAASDAAADAGGPGAEKAPSGDPRIDEIRKKYAEIQADKGLSTSEVRMACPAREGRAEVRLHRKNNVVSRAELKDIAAGDAGSTYQFYYDNGQLIFALNDAEPFGGLTELRLLQRRYYYHQGSPILCTKRSVVGPPDKVEALLQQAPNEPVDCAFGLKVQRLASVVSRGAEATDELKKLLCPQPPGQTGR